MIDRSFPRHVSSARICTRGQCRRSAHVSGQVRSKASCYQRRFDRRLANQAMWPETDTVSDRRRHGSIPATRSERGLLCCLSLRCHAVERVKLAGNSTARSKVRNDAVVCIFRHHTSLYWPREGRESRAATSDACGDMGVSRSSSSGVVLTHFSPHGGSVYYCLGLLPNPCIPTQRLLLFML